MSSMACRSSGLGNERLPAAGRQSRCSVKASGRVPVAQLDSSSGFLIRRSQVRVLPGTPLSAFEQSMPAINNAD